jgi:hypothetical protein
MTLDSQLKHTYQPRGSMCLACVYKLDNCSHHPFHEMYTITKYLRGETMVHSVKCTWFKHVKNTKVSTPSV